MWGRLRKWFDIKVFGEPKPAINAPITLVYLYKYFHNTLIGNHIAEINGKIADKRSAIFPSWCSMSSLSTNKQTKKKPDQGGDHHDNHHHDQGDVDHDSCICRPAGFLSAT